MSYKIRGYGKCPFETYEPKKRIGIKPEEAVPLVVRVCHKFVFLGGYVTLVSSSILLFIYGFFGVKEKVKNLTPRGKTVEFKIKTN